MENRRKIVPKKNNTYHRDKYQTQMTHQNYETSTPKNITGPPIAQYHHAITATAFQSFALIANRAVRLGTLTLPRLCCIPLLWVATGYVRGPRIFCRIHTMYVRRHPTHVTTYVTTA